MQVGNKTVLSYIEYHPYMFPFYNLLIIYLYTRGSREMGYNSTKMNKSSIQAKCLHTISDWLKMDEFVNNDIDKETFSFF